MKNVLAAACLSVLLVCSTAFAQTQYSQTITFDPSLSIGNGKGHPTATFSFNDITTFEPGPGGDYPKLTLALTGTSYTDKLYLVSNDGVIFLGDVDSKHQYSYTFTDTSVLNSANRNGTITFQVAWDKKAASPISAATLKGTLAPEPASMALVGAGLISLPFVRRLKNGVTGRSGQAWFNVRS